MSSTLTPPIRRIGPEHNGTRLSPEEFDAIDDWDPAYRYELQLLFSLADDWDDE
jgi:hypothetical protein